MAQSPCQHCADKRMGCHGVCKDYNDYVVQNKKEKEWLKQKNSTTISECNFVDQAFKRSRYQTKRGRRT